MRLIAHRGYSSIAPENTRAAFELALQCGAAAVECDLQRTRDDYLVVLHDGTLNRTTNGRGAVRSKSLEELRSLSAGYANKFGSQFATERLMTFEELLLLVRHRAHLFAEIKREALARDGRDRREMIRLVHEKAMRDEVTFISFEWNALETMRSMSPAIRLGLLFDRYRPKTMSRLAKSLHACMLMGRVDLVVKHPEFISEAHREGLQVGAYTVDTLPFLKQLAHLGVDGVATNRIGDFVCEFDPDNHFPPVSS
ncbi:MAG: glycerophosphodiester phosphodiesterase [Terriglobia bacterium]